MYVFGLGQTPIYPKIVHRSLLGGARVIALAPAVPFDQLDDAALVDTNDLMHVFQCSPATVYRCIYERGLEPSERAGRVMLFAKGEVIAWLQVNGTPGR